jgi:hypothetical protein
MGRTRANSQCLRRSRSTTGLRSIFDRFCGKTVAQHLCRLWKLLPHPTTNHVCEDYAPSAWLQNQLRDTIMLGFGPGRAGLHAAGRSARLRPRGGQSDRHTGTARALPLCSVSPRVGHRSAKAPRRDRGEGQQGRSWSSTGRAAPCPAGADLGGSRRHVGPGFVDEDQTGRIDAILIGHPLLTSPRHVGTISLAGNQRLFL